MRTFLIDLENVKSAGLQGIDRLEADDRVFVFYSENANTLTISTIQAMNRSKATVEYVHLLHSGHNAMDFQIVALLGFLIGSERKGQFCITSMDNGYVSPVEFFMDHSAGSLDVHVLLAGSIQKALNRWSNMEKQEAAKRVVVADPAEMKDEPEEEKAEAEAAAMEEAALAAAEAAETETEAAVAIDTPAAPAAETAAEPAKEPVEKAAQPEKIAEPEKNTDSEKTAEPAAAPVKRRRGRPRKSEQKKNGQQKAAAQVKPEEPAKTAEQKPAEQKAAELKSAEQKAPEQPKQTEKPKQAEQAKPAEQKPVEQKAAEQKAPEQPKQTEQPKQKRRPVVVPPAFAVDVREIVKDHLPEGNQTVNEKMVAEAILGTESKNEFYQFLRRALGTKKGGDLYHQVRGDYDRLIAALEKNLNS
ncbi:MAG: hypothetical protein IJL53_09310 [Firmicutes bacterium]|nr:hypothetical protein [Bacillota bacterium]